MPPTRALTKMRAAVLPSFTRVEIRPAGLVVEKFPSNSADPGGCTSQITDCPPTAVPHTSVTTA